MTRRGSLRGLAAAAAAAISLLAAGAAARAETLTDALIAAYTNSNLLEQNRALLRAADEDVATAIAALRPVVEWALTSRYTDTNLTDPDITTTLSLSAQMTIYDFGRTPLAVDVAKESVLATRDGLLQVEQNVLLQAVRAYMEVIRAARFVDLRRNNVRLITNELRAARERFEVGEITRTDVSLAEAALAAARAALSAAEGDYNVAREAYKAAVGHYPKNLVRPTVPPMTADTLDAARAVAVKTHPLIHQRQREVTIAELNIARARADLRPRITGGASASINDDEVRSGTLELRLGQTIYSGGALASALRRAVALAEADRAELLQAVLTVKQNVADAWTALRVAVASTEANQRQVNAARIAFNGVREEASLGARTTLDVLDAEQELLDARAALIEAEINQFIAVYSLLSTMGLLTVQHLDLGIVTYDPSAYYAAVESAPVRHVSPQGEKLDRVLKSLGK
ncbi:TolC family outer membrane protein [Psychromarinibacter sp. C21-152]|uniref:TolC family outer membrane protein n=1 Tax=Psychromarinibacter sediminicola TaxID=3033385 RepID=A0AAE3NM96_9RHOB|nr:TolC family outer membrane protein [Psychromarinibacter sediminicola]MDF0599923.1 TolC family outer membrane protein [Psychromarinibacter sediminicola]